MGEADSVMNQLGRAGRSVAGVTSTGKSALTSLSLLWFPVTKLIDDGVAAASADMRAQRRTTCGAAGRGWLALLSLQASVCSVVPLNLCRASTAANGRGR